MTIEPRRVNGVLVLRVSGRLDTYAGAGLMRRTIRVALRRGERRLVFDCGRLGRVESPGFDTLLSCRRAVHRAGGDLKLASLGCPAEDPVVVAGLRTAFDVHDTAVAAVNAFDTDPAAVRG